MLLDLSTPFKLLVDLCQFVLSVVYLVSMFPLLLIRLLMLRLESWMCSLIFWCPVFSIFILKSHFSNSTSYLLSIEYTLFSSFAFTTWSSAKNNVVNHLYLTSNILLQWWNAFREYISELVTNTLFMALCFWEEFWYGISVFDRAFSIFMSHMFNHFR